jgi:hypothetical protein
MLLTLFALAMAATPQSANAASAAKPPVPAENRFQGRPEARIAFAHDVRNFQVKREGNDDILFLETRRDTWYRSEINCTGIADPRDAQALAPIGPTSGIDSFSRVALIGFNSSHSQCFLNSLIELTPQEAIEFRLVRPKSAPRPTPAS